MIALLAVHRGNRPPSLEGLYDDYHRRGHQTGIDSPFRGGVLVARDSEIVFKQAYGEVLQEREGDFTLAARSYTRAVELARRNGDRSLPAYERSLSNLTERIAEGAP